MVVEEEPNLMPPEITIEGEDSSISETSTAELQESPSFTEEPEVTKSFGSENNTDETDKIEVAVPTIVVEAATVVNRRFSQNPNAAGAARRYQSESRKSSSMDSTNIDRKGHNPRRRKTSVFLPEIDQDDLGDYDKDLGQYTIEKMPQENNYRNLQSIHASSRPTLDDLLGDAEESKEVLNGSEISLLNC